jgi:NAD(P)-dependent dehydrogenase (short-subunit alcohol dehydrogenase family)
MTDTRTRNALVTGASRGLGRALAEDLAAAGWRVVADARGRADLDRLTARAGIVTIPGDVTDAAHRNELARAVEQLDGLDLLVNNASTLGPSPLPRLAGYPSDALRTVFEVNVVAPLALTRLLLPALRTVRGAIVNISSDAAVEAYPGWGGYGTSKAALDQLSAVLAVEEPDLAVYAFDPGDMRTDMHQLAFPGDDISDRPEAASVVPALVRLLEKRPPSARYQVGEFR